MPIRMDQMMQLLCQVSQEKGMKATVKQSFRGGLMAITAACIGGLVGGPAGIALGGVLGLLGACMMSGQFKPVPQILMELPPAEQQKLYIEAIVVLKSLDWTDFDRLSAVVMSSDLLQLQLAKLLENYFTRELGAVIKYGE